MEYLKKVPLSQMNMGAFSEKNYSAKFGWATAKKEISGVQNCSENFSIDTVISFPYLRNNFEQLITISYSSVLPSMNYKS